MGIRDYGDDDEGGGDDLKNKVFDEFDCPECNANNPYGDGFRAGDEVNCYYCGSSFKVRIQDNGKPRYVPL